MTAERSARPARPTGRTRAAVAAFLRTHPGATPRAIADGTGMSHDLVKKTTARMRLDGEVTTAGRGHYFLARRRHLSPVPPTGDTPDAGTVSPAQAGDTRAENQARAPAAVTQPGDSESSARWVCGCCWHRQAVGSVQNCEQCGAGRYFGTVPL